MKRTQRTQPVALARLVPKVLGELGFDETALILRITGRWEEVVGAEASRHSRPDVLRGGVLEVLVDSSVWCQEIQVQRSRMMGELRRIFGEEAPKELRLRLGSSALDFEA